MTTFCLVHGAWHDDACWAPLVALLEARGHQCITPVLPLEDDDASFEDYAKVVVDCLNGCESPVVVGHSLSSAVIPLVALERPVALLVYLCPAMAGFAAPAGEPPYRRAGYDSPPVDAAGRMYWPRERAITQLYARLDRGRPSASPTDCAPSPRAYSTSRIRSRSRPRFLQRSCTRARTNYSTTTGRGRPARCSPSEELPTADHPPHRKVTSTRRPGTPRHPRGRSHLGRSRIDPIERPRQPIPRPPRAHRYR